MALSMTNFYHLSPLAPESPNITLQIMYFSCSHAQVEPSHWFLRSMAHTTDGPFQGLVDEWRHMWKIFPKKFLQLLNLAIFTTLSLRPPRSTRSSSVVTLSRPPTISLKITDRSFIYMCITSSLESTSRFIPSASPFLSRFTSSSTYQLISVIIPTLVIHLSLSLQTQNLPFQQILPAVDFFYLLDCLTITGLDRTYQAHHFVFSFTL